MTFEWRGAERLTGWLWVALLVLIATPFPMGSIPLPERGVPLMWLLLAGGAAIMARIARASWPLAALVGWALVRSLWTGLIVDPSSISASVVVMEAGRARPFQLLILVGLVGLLYVAAREMPARIATVAAWALVVGVAYEAVFGYLNLWRVYPWMTFIVPDQVGRPMGFLTHPNYWGSYMALGLPVLWSLGGILPVILVFGMICAAFSGGPVISAAAGLAFCAWPQLSRRARYWCIATLATVVSVVMTVHEWRLSGRREVWAAVWPELMRYPIIGQGIGSWRVWADHFNVKRATQTGTYEAFATLQAHNEPYQLWFELGLIGLLLLALLGLQAVLAALVTCEATKARAWSPTAAWWKPGRVPLERAWVAMLVVAAVNALGSPLMHLPGQAAIVVFALARVQACAALTLLKEQVRVVRGNGPRAGVATRRARTMTRRTKVAA